MAKKFLNYLFIFIFLTTNYYLLTTTSHALELQSPQFKLDVGDMNIDSPTSKSVSLTAESTLGKEAYAQFKEFGFSLITSEPSEDFTFGLSQSNINLGEIKGAKTLTGETSFTIKSPNPHRFDITMIQEYPLKNSSDKEIPPTSCNGANQTCNKSFAKAWTSSSSFGLGYSLSGKDIPLDFINSQYFRPLPSLEHNDLPVFLSSSQQKTNYQEKVSFKLKVPLDQPEGTYESLINFIAVPIY